MTATGGGYGNPLNRPAEKVVEDVKNGYITLAQAKDVYGVSVDPATYDFTLTTKRINGGNKA
jgi:N-methylhydantoinase B